jgi:hypothetical protein
MRADSSRQSAEKILNARTRARRGAGCWRGPPIAGRQIIAKRGWGEGKPAWPIAHLPSLTRANTAKVQVDLRSQLRGPALHTAFVSWRGACLQILAVRCGHMWSV